MLRKVAALLMALMMFPCLSHAQERVVVDAINAPAAAEGFSFARDAELLQIVFPKVLNADATLFICGGETLLLDCASAYQAGWVVELLTYMGVDELDYVVNTHPHYDHLEGFAMIAETVKVKSFYICYNEEETEHMVNALKVCREKDIPVVCYDDGDRLNLGGAVIDVWRKCKAKDGLNATSAQMRVQFGQRTALFTADATQRTQRELVDVIPPELLKADLLKYPHHGKEALINDFAAAVSPAFAVITNNGGKASVEARKCLSYKNIPHAVTVAGYVSWTTDGETWLVEYLDEGANEK